MNLIGGAPLWLILLLCGILAAAAVEDAVRLRISNVTVLGVVAAAAAAIVASGPSAGLWQNLLIFAALLAIGTLMFSAGLLGGGDVKLFAAVGLWVNLGQVLVLVASILIAGGLLAVLVLSARFLPRRSGRGPGGRGRKVPYAVAIAIGGLFVIALERSTFATSHPDPLAFRPPGSSYSQAVVNAR